MRLLATSGVAHVISVFALSLMLRLLATSSLVLFCVVLFVFRLFVCLCVCLFVFCFLMLLATSLYIIQDTSEHAHATV